MFRSLRLAAAAAGLAALSACATVSAAQPAADRPHLAEGLVRTPSAYSFEETIARIRADVAAKGIPEYAVVPQSRLGQDAGVDVRPSTLILFGNPPLGTQFLTANPNAGIDWPVRVLVYEDAAGRVWAVHNDFRYLERRHGIDTRGEAFGMANTVIGSIMSSVADSRAVAESTNPPRSSRRASSYPRKAINGSLRPA